MDTLRESDVISIHIPIYGKPKCTKLPVTSQPIPMFHGCSCYIHQIVLLSTCVSWILIGFHGYIHNIYGLPSGKLSHNEPENHHANF